MFNSKQTNQWKVKQTQQNNSSAFNTANSNNNLDLNGYLSQIASFIQNENGKSLSQLLSFKHISKQHILQRVSEKQLSQSCIGILKHCKPWNVILWHYLQSIAHSTSDKLKKAWDSSLLALKFLKADIIIQQETEQPNAFHISPNVWYLSVLNTIFKNTNECAIALHANMKDDEISEHDTEDVIVQTVNEYLLIVRKMSTDNISGSSHKPTIGHGLVCTVNYTIKLCDIINNETIKQMALSSVQKFRSSLTFFPLSDVVTHLYFMGRSNAQKGGKHLYKAKKDLEYAHKLCLGTSLNKVRILLRLAPIQIIFGMLPNLNSNRVHKCLKERFFPIIGALKSGNILLFKKAMNYYEDDFINCDIYLLLSKLEILVFRSLVYRVCATKKKMNGCNNPHIVNLSEIKQGIEIRNKEYHESQWKIKFDGDKKEKEEDMDEMLVNEMNEDEIECLLSTLIYKKLIGGYVAHNTACVLSKMNDKAFPPIKSCKDWWINDF